MNKKPIFTVHWFGQGYDGAAFLCQAVKAVDEAEARRKFLKKYPKVLEDNITDVDLLEETHKHYRILANKEI